MYALISFSNAEPASKENVIELITDTVFWKLKRLMQKDLRLFVEIQTINRIISFLNVGFCELAMSIKVKTLCQMFTNIFKLANLTYAFWCQTLLFVPSVVFSSMSRYI